MTTATLKIAPIQAETVIIGVAVLAGLFLLYKGISKADDIAEAVNPFNNDNVINQGFTNAYQYLTGSAGSLGTDIYDLTHDQVNPTTGKVTKAPVQAVLNNSLYYSNPAYGLFTVGKKVAEAEFAWLNKKVSDLFK